MTTAPSLEVLTLPPADGNWGRWLADRCSRRLARARAAVESLTSAASGAREPLETLQIWNDVTIALGDALSAATVLIQVHPDDSIRSQAETAAQEAKRLATDISLNRSVYDVLCAVETAALDPAAARVLRLALRGRSATCPSRRRSWVSASRRTSVVATMRAANDFGRAYQTRTQLFFAAVSNRLHLGPVDDIDALIRHLEAEYDLFAHVEGTHFHASFGHLETYTSAYYTYMWSLVIAKDLFSAFAAAGLFDAATARR